MFQDARLLPWRPVRDNVTLGLPRAAGAALALRQVGLEDRARLAGRAVRLAAPGIACAAECRSFGAVRVCP